MKRSLIFTFGRVLGVVGGAWGAIATAAIFMLPMQRMVVTTSTSSGETITRSFMQTLLEGQGELEPVTIFFFAAMVGLSLAALAVSLIAHRSPRRAGLVVLVAGILLLLGSFISGFSVGGFYLPGALLVLLASILMLLG